MNGGFDYRSRIFLILWTVNFLFTFSTNLIPTPRAYLTKLFVGGVEASTMEALGIMFSLGYAAATVGYFVGGFAADSLGKRTVVIMSFGVLAAGCGMFVIAPNLYFLYAANFVEFFATGFSSPAISALVADCSEQSSRGMAYGMFNLSWVSAGIAGPLIAGFTAQYVTLQTPFVIAVLVSIIGLLLASFLKSKKVEKHKNGKNGTEVQKASMKLSLSFRRVIFIFSLTNLMNGLLNGFINPVLNGMLLFKLGAAPAEYGLVLSLSSSLVTGLVQIPGGKLADKFGRKPLVLFSFLGAPLALLLGFSGSLLDFSLIMGGISAIGNISSPAISAWLMDLVPEHRRASASGITQSLNGAGLTIGPSAGSYVWNSTNSDAIVSCGVAALLFVASLPFYLMLEEPKKSSSQTGSSSQTLS
ncbi:MAG TPA: MFS transporter [Candidatus Acidoferrales bacterium]|nr:MFS transporter [Candidatus Acidoferrales bacterium]